MKLYFVTLMMALGLSLYSADETVLVNPGGPVSQVVVISPLTIEEAQKWLIYSQVILVKEKDGILLDTMVASNQMLIVHSISYFKGANGQLFAIVNYLRPRPQVK